MKYAYLFLLLTMISVNTYALKFSSELICLKSAQNLINKTNDLGYYDSITQTFTFNDDNTFYIVSENHVKTCPYDNSSEYVTYKIPVNDTRFVFYSKTEYLNLYGTDEVKNALELNKCTDILDKKIETKIKIAITTILRKLNDPQTADQKELTAEELQNAKKSCEPIVEKLKLNLNKSNGQSRGKSSPKLVKKNQ